MADICMNGVGGVEIITMNKKVGDKLEAGMAVTQTGADNEVGLGLSAGSALFGIITHTEKDDTVAVQVSGAYVGVPITGTAANQPAIGGSFACNDKGELIKMETPPTNTRGIITAVDKTAKSATVLL